jgi:hypothetical protein
MAYKLGVEQVKAKLVESGKIDITVLDNKIKAKISELSGLISEEGAAHIIANELGVNVLPDVQNTRMKIRDLAPGMNGVEMLAKVAQIWELREFSKNDYSGKVQSMLIADETGKTRFTLWNDQADNFSGSQEGDIILIKGIYVKENNGKTEAHLGKGGTFEINPEGENMDNVKISSGFERKDLVSLTGGEEGIEVMGTVVQVFDPRFFHVHPETGRRIREGEEGDVTPVLSYVMNAIVDDGSSNIRCVFWKAQVNMLLNVDEAKMNEYYEDLSQFEDQKTDLLGEQFVIRGNVKHNEMFDRLEFSVRTVTKADPEKEIAVLEKKEEATVEAKQEEATEIKKEVVEEPVAEEVKVEEVIETETKPEEVLEEEAVSLDSIEDVPLAKEEVQEVAKEEKVEPTEAKVEIKEEVVAENLDETTVAEEKLESESSESNESGESEDNADIEDNTDTGDTHEPPKVDEEMIE